MSSQNITQSVKSGIAGVSTEQPTSGIVGLKGMSPQAQAIWNRLSPAARRNALAVKDAS